MGIWKTYRFGYSNLAFSHFSTWRIIRSLVLAQWCRKTDVFMFCVCFWILKILTNSTPPIAVKQIEGDSNLKDLQRQQLVISFDKSMKAISIVRHLIDHSLSPNSVLPLGVGRRLLETNDVTLLLCQLIEQSPWYALGENKGTGQRCRLFWHESGMWIPVEQMTSSVGKAEGQVNSFWFWG